MDFLKDKIKPMFFKYLLAAFGSALITSIYSIVDASMVGQYHGADGSAALAVVAPIWNVIYSLGLLMGIGGSVLLSSQNAKPDNDGTENKYFTIAIIGSIFLSIICWITIFLFDGPILTFFGADETLLVLAKRYLTPIKFVFPLFLINQMLSAFLRNDKNPLLTTIAVLAGGIFNIIGDYLFVFVFDMGIFGAGLATAIGAALTLVILLIHFFTKKNTLKIIKPERFFKEMWEVTYTGFPTFFIDAAMGILTVLFNRQIMKYLGGNALAIYGPILQISTFVQCSAYSVGQASQPIISTNYGANKGDRIKETLKLGIIVSFAFALIYTSVSLIYPNGYIYIFMIPTDEILKMAPSIIRSYALSFILLPINIYFTYYFQAILKPKISFLISILRGLVISGTLILVLPLFGNPNLLWFAMPITELLVFILSTIFGIKYTRELLTKKVSIE